MSAAGEIGRLPETGKRYSSLRMEEDDLGVRQSWSHNGPGWPHGPMIRKTGIQKRAKSEALVAHSPLKLHCRTSDTSAPSLLAAAQMSFEMLFFVPCLVGSMTISYCHSHASEIRV